MDEKRYIVWVIRACGGCTTHKHTHTQHLSHAAICTIYRQFSQYKYHTRISAYARASSHIFNQFYFFQFFFFFWSLVRYDFYCYALGWTKNKENWLNQIEFTLVYQRVCECLFKSLHAHLSSISIQEIIVMRHSNHQLITLTRHHIFLIASYLILIQMRSMLRLW